MSSVNTHHSNPQHAVALSHLFATMELYFAKFGWQLYPVVPALTVPVVGVIVPPDTVTLKIDRNWQKPGHIIIKSDIPHSPGVGLGLVPRQPAGAASPQHQVNPPPGLRVHQLRRDVRRPVVRDVADHEAVIHVVQDLLLVT